VIFDGAVWTPVTVNTSGYVDVRQDPFPSGGDYAYTAALLPRLDIVGTATGSLWAGYTAQNDSNLMFRMRVDVDPSSAGGVHAVLLNTDGDDWVDYVFQIDNVSDLRVEIGATTSSVGPSSTDPWGDTGSDKLTYNADTAVGLLATGTYHQYTSAGSSIGVTADWFVDLAIPWSVFSSVTGLTRGETFSTAFATSTQHAVMNSDQPDYNPLGWSDPLTVPEPGSFGLLGLAACVGLLRRRRTA